MNRRQFLASAGTGAALGVGWGSGFTLALRRGEPTLEVIGSSDAMIALLNTRQFRALIVVGYLPRELRDGIPSLLGVFRPRIDLVVGSRAGIAVLGTPFVVDHGVANMIVLDDGSDIRASESNRVATPPVLTAALPEGVSLEIRSFASGLWGLDSGARHSWVVSIRRGAGISCLGPSLGELSRFGPTTPTLAMAPLGSLAYAQAMLAPAAIAVNATNVDDGKLGGEVGDGSPYLVRLHDRDPAVFTLHHNGISLPTWCEHREFLKI